MIADDPAVQQALGRDIGARYGDQLRLVTATSGEEALSALRQLRQQNELVAAVLAGQQLPGMSGIALLVEARALYPEAGRVLLAAHTDAEAAIARINEIGIDHYLVKPWGDPHARLYPLLDELLEDWKARVRLPSMQVKDIMDTRVARIRHSASLHQAAEIVALSGVGDLMVVDERGAFVGVLSEGDILRNALPDTDEILGAGGTLYDAFQLFVRKGRDLSDRPIMPLVIREPIVLNPSDHVARAAAVLIERQIRRLPVVQDGQLVGTVSRANICQAVVGTL
jgi:CBS domain-containing protein